MSVSGKQFYYKESERSLMEEWKKEIENQRLYKHIRYTYPIKTSSDQSGPFPEQGTPLKTVPVSEIDEKGIDIGNNKIGSSESEPLNDVEEARNGVKLITICGDVYQFCKTDSPKAVRYINDPTEMYPFEKVSRLDWNRLGAHSLSINSESMVCYHAEQACIQFLGEYYYLSKLE